jgi:hypothetical protein
MISSGQQAQHAVLTAKINQFHSYPAKRGVSYQPKAASVRGMVSAQSLTHTNQPES